MKRFSRDELREFNPVADDRLADIESRAISRVLIAVAVLIGLAILVVAEMSLPLELRMGLFQANFFSL